jgi:hypothetical protein
MTSSNAADVPLLDTTNEQTTAVVERYIVVALKQLNRHCPVIERTARGQLLACDKPANQRSWKRTRAPGAHKVHVAIRRQGDIFRVISWRVEGRAEFPVARIVRQDTFTLRRNLRGCQVRAPVAYGRELVCDKSRMKRVVPHANHVMAERYGDVIRLAVWHVDGEAGPGRPDGPPTRIGCGANNHQYENRGTYAKCILCGASKTL